eukprot:SAG11_NODE_2539_length_3242_cov_3.190900_2_plen_185_part_00
MKNAKPQNIFPLLRATRHPLGQDLRAFERRYGGDAPDLAELHARIGATMLRKTKAECLDLPPKHRHLVDLDIEAEICEEARARYQTQLERTRQTASVSHFAVGAAAATSAALEDEAAEAELLAGGATGQQRVKADMSARGQLFRLRHLASLAKAEPAATRAVALMRVSAPPPRHATSLRPETRD